MEEKVMEQKNTLQLISKYKGAIMGFAAWCIVIFHDWQPVFGRVPVLGPLEVGLKQIGFFGVDVFFLLSGLGLTYAIQKGSVWSFYWRRIKRLLIPAVVLSLFRLWADGWSLLQWVKNLTGYAFYTESIYSFLWFVPAISTLYLFFPLYYKLFLRADNKVAFTGIAVVGWLAVSLLGVIRYDAYGFTNRIPVFLLGVLLGWMTQNKEVMFKRSTWLLMGCFLALGPFLSYQTSVKQLYLLVPVSNCCLPTFFTAVATVFLLAKGLDRISHTRLGQRIEGFLRFFGLFSLEFYCIQEAQLGQRLLPLLAGLPTAFVNVICLAAIIGAGLLLYLLQKYSWKAIDGMIKRCKTFR